MIKIIIIFLFLFVACGVPTQDWKVNRPSDEQWKASIDVSLEKWIFASQNLPREKLHGLQSAGFFEIGNSIYSDHCDSHGNMIRLKYNDENNMWKQIKYETLSCVGFEVR